MVKLFLTLNLCLVLFHSQSQINMRPITDLINTQEPGWDLVKNWIDSATNKVEILPADSVRARETLYQAQVTTRSPMGAIIYTTGGLLIDHGWIRIIGSGHPRLNRSIHDWNKNKAFDENGNSKKIYLIADDAIGGFFALNGGALGENIGKVYYLAPDNLLWEPTDLTYSSFLTFCFTGNLNDFYKDYRWKDWQKEVSTLPGDKVFNFYPPLWTKEGKNLDKTSRKTIPVEEQYQVNMSFIEQLKEKD
ncbi:MAG: DUF2625 domain-containing protein [Chitinophagaceae bacterium]